MQQLLKPIFVITLLLTLALSPQPTLAQNTLTPYVPVEGSIEAPGATESWTFTGSESTVISISVESADDSLDPSVTLLNGAGEILTSNDDIVYPDDRNALLQAVTLPRADTYTVIVEGYGETTGAYTLTMTQGYGEIRLAENFNGDTTTWDTPYGDLALDLAAGQLTLSLAGLGAEAYALNEPQGEYTDFYADTTITLATGRNGWIAGLTLRQTGRTYYRLMLNHQGQWRLDLVRSGGEQTLRDWTNHPAIVAGQEEFTLGVLANGGTFDVFYNNIFVGQARDAEETLTSGDVGLYVQTTNNAGSETQVAFDSLTVTVPSQVTLLPHQIVSGAQALTIQELERRRVISTGGEAALTVGESTATLATLGINRLLLGRGTTFGDLVISANLRWQTSGSGAAGCGLIFGRTSDTEYSLAYLDQTGGYGLSPRTGDTFAPGIFGINREWIQGRQHLLIVRMGDTVHYYVNRQHVGTMEIPSNEGEIGVAVVNYETISTTCTFNDLWVWRLG
jgi:hypothetical protein